MPEVVEFQGEVHICRSDQIEDNYSAISYWLTKQPESYEPFYSREGLINAMLEGRFIPMLFSTKGENVGMILCSIHEYNPGFKTLKIDCLFFENFFSVARFFLTIEELAKRMEVDYIEGVLHPAIAKYVVGKKGARASGVYVNKPVYYGGLH